MYELIKLTYVLQTKDALLSLASVTMFVHGHVPTQTQPTHVSASGTHTTSLSIYQGRYKFETLLSQ